MWLNIWKKENLLGHVGTKNRDINHVIAYWNFTLLPLAPQYPALTSNPSGQTISLGFDILLNNIEERFPQARL